MAICERCGAAGRLPKVKATECGATHGTGVRCTLPAGHAGDHVAQVFDARILGQWPRKQTAATDESENKS